MFLHIIFGIVHRERPQFWIAHVMEIDHNAPRH
jgi:hypothetical protein